MLDSRGYWVSKGGQDVHFVRSSPSGSNGVFHISLPKDWIGKRVKVKIECV